MELCGSLVLIIVFLLAYTFISKSLRGNGFTLFHSYPNNVKIVFSIIYLVIVSGVIYIGLHLIYSLLLVILNILIPVLGWYFFLLQLT
jgi:hypothetical protein